MRTTIRVLLLATMLAAFTSFTGVEAQAPQQVCFALGSMSASDAAPPSDLYQAACLDCQEGWVAGDDGSGGVTCVDPNAGGGGNGPDPAAVVCASWAAVNDAGDGCESMCPNSNERAVYLLDNSVDVDSYK